MERSLPLSELNKNEQKEIICRIKDKTEYKGKLVKIFRNQDCMLEIADKITGEKSDVFIRGTAIDFFKIPELPYKIIFARRMAKLEQESKLLVQQLGEKLSNKKTKAKKKPKANQENQIQGAPLPFKTQPSFTPGKHGQGQSHVEQRTPFSNKKRGIKNKQMFPSSNQGHASQVSPINQQQGSQNQGLSFPSRDLGHASRTLPFSPNNQRLPLVPINEEQQLVEFQPPSDFHNQNYNTQPEEYGVPAQAYQDQSIYVPPYYQQQSHYAYDPGQHNQEYPYPLSSTQQGVLMVPAEPVGYYPVYQQIIVHHRTYPNAFQQPNQATQLQQMQVLQNPVPPYMYTHGYPETQFYQRQPPQYFSSNAYAQRYLPTRSLPTQQPQQQIDPNSCHNAYPPTQSLQNPKL